MSFRYVMGMAVLFGAGLAQAVDKPIVGDTTAGAAKAATCGACHGADGNPASSQYPKLAGQNEAYTARQVDLMKSGKRQNAVMMGFIANLSAQDMHDIGAFYASKVSLPGVADTALVARGQALYRGGSADTHTPACMACHGPDGRGNPGAVYPQLAGQYADYTAAKLKAFRDGQGFSYDEHAKIMTTVAKPLTDADITALASYIEGLHAVTAKAAEIAK
ncbi:MAG: c-type cytochrome [Rudaea sp.]|uniref:c-type cytochrome n=1 Tax=Rudaea sp. TaxID=2136325 RepID=UPI0039E5EA98